MRQRLRDLWAKRHEDVRLTKGIAAAVGSVFGSIVGILMIGVTLLAVWLHDEEVDRRTDRATDRGRVEAIDRRVDETDSRIDRLERACRRTRPCARQIDVDQQRQRRQQERRRRREESPPRSTIPNADRPPRSPSTPPPSPEPVAGTPPPPARSTPSVHAPSAPDPQRPTVVLPPLDLDGPDGLLPEVAPQVNVPPVDLPDVTLPELRQ